MYCVIIAWLGLTITQHGSLIWCEGKTSSHADPTIATTAGPMVSTYTDEVSVTNATDGNDEIETTSHAVSESTSMATSTVITTFTENGTETSKTSTEYHNETTTLTVSEATSSTRSFFAMTTDVNTALESTIPEAGHKTTTSVPEFTSRRAYTTNPSSGTTNSHSSIILYLAIGSVTVFVVMIVVGVMVIIRYKRRINRLKTSIEKSESNSKRKRTRSSSELFGHENMAMHDIVENECPCQTVAHVPRITRGSVEYAVPVPPGNYSYAFTPYDSSLASNNEASALENKSKGLFKSGIKLPYGEEEKWHPYFRLRPLIEPVIEAAANESSTEDTLCVANGKTDVTPNNTELPIHIYNHIKLKQGKTECDGDSGVLCSGEYSHISIKSDTASGKSRYYNIVNIQRARTESVDNYCHLGPNNTSIKKRVPRDDYDHVAM
ncbi:uncharacterized protein LOC127845137 isoform X2 [Dreissena polymorpha]|uniref:uncharacterized protein LOC127845137 isoform X2 n=1 Tax=Dreissena polymorpha TaxID=45954 RepID=UPI002264CAF1|nr:uncharacterized protein LOC127845137 isoform X2 [Dreissena polymorpha]